MHGTTPGKGDATQETCGWRRFSATFAGVFAGGLAVIYLLILLIDPYRSVPFSLPMERPIVSISQRYMYPQIVRSGRYDGVVVGSSTARLIDPEILNPGFGRRFANLSMDSMTAWEQQQLVSLYLREVGAPKALIVGLDTVWCAQNADRVRITPAGFPEWLYDTSRWNDLLYLLNSATLEIAGRLAANKLGLYRERLRADGFGVFVPPEEQYDLKRAQGHIWQGRAREIVPQEPAVVLSEAERKELRFPALAYLEDMLAALPSGTEVVLAFMPVHVAAQPVPGTRGAAIEAECKARITAIGKSRNAVVADWRIPTGITTKDTNYWDNLHYRLPIAHRIASDLAGPIRAGRETDGSFRILSSPQR
ncbi:hypothetical protein [Pseudorhodoplanes sp.]|uniref:hypothetical protein n=1 Tax=Pseudorhodoplanes sp. TaxID=1934341 RepID=UPI002C14E972|nr:hypothetical protein [Pseudorhodoplanes sp.]HWV53883.1 hypothetical protein [Pseudorhodoplanes sp.]